MERHRGTVARLLLTTLVGCAFPICVSAQVAPPATPSPAPKNVVVSGFSDFGYVDVFNTDKVRFKNGNQSRIFDGVEGPFFNPLSGALFGQPYDFNATPDLNNLNLQVAFNGSIGGKIQASVGTDADFIASYGQHHRYTNITQAYAQYTRGALTVLLGKFESLAGFEAIESTRNLNYSHAYLSGYAVPGTHTGVRVTYAPNQNVSATFGINDGWDDITFNGKGATFEGNLTIAPSPALSFSFTTYNGRDYTGQPLATGHAYGNRALYDAIVTVHPTKRLELAANYDNGRQFNTVRFDSTGTEILAPGGEPLWGVARWSGVAAYAAYAFTPRLSLALRAETFRDDGGFRTGYDQRLQSRTATIAYAPTSHLVLRGEYRIDTSDNPVFQQRPNLDTTPGRAYQNSIGFEGLVTF